MRMRRVASQALGRHKSFRAIEGSSDATTLPDDAVRLITVGRALHWFPSRSTRAEFTRILEPGGWLAIFSVPWTDSALLDSLKAVRVPENGWEAALDKDHLSYEPPSFYFGHHAFRTLSAPGSAHETWEAFLGRVSSMAAAPAQNHPLRGNFERALRDVFDRHAERGVLTVSNTTQILFGKLQQP